MTLRTHVFTDPDGRQHLLLVYPSGALTIAHRGDQYAAWGPPVREDEWYRDQEPRPVQDMDLKEDVL